MLEQLTVTSADPYEDLPYEWVTAIASFAVDPDDPANTRVTDLGLAPRDTDGLVRFDADVRILRPTSGGAGRALLSVPNRGMTMGLPFNHLPDPQFGLGRYPAGMDAFLPRRGWTVAWCGWQWDVPRTPTSLGLTAPVADVEPGWLRVEFRPDADQDDHALSDSNPLVSFSDYPTADRTDPQAVLTVRTSPMGPEQTVPRSRWRFTGDTRFEVEGGFRAFHWYRLRYRSAFAPVVGAGLLALRDFGASLRAGHSHVLTTGISQSGRVLRHLLHEGMNLDEHGNQVFDGVFAQVASARRGEFNQRYGQPALLHPLTPAYGAPLDTTALLGRQRAAGGVPKTVLVNSAYEYWRGDGALVHQDPHTGDDLPEDPDARTYLISGTDHLGPVSFLKTAMPLANPPHLLDPTLVTRALFVQLDEWVSEGREPEPSQVPRRGDGTAVTREEVLASFPEPALPDPEHLTHTPAIDPDTAWPLRTGEPLVALVSAVDANGNERAGIRLPEVAVGAAAYTGWNPRAHVDGLPDVLYEMPGSRLPVPGTAARPDAAAIRAAAQDLVAHRFLLPEDLEHAVEQGLRELGDPPK